MRSLVEIEIRSGQRRTAELFADPNNNPKWMHDIERVEHLSGVPGQPGSTYRLVPKQGSDAFVATVVARELPSELKLVLDAPGVTVSITDRMSRLSDGMTRLVSEEVFRFKGLFRTLFGVLASGQIKAAHRRHIESFKRFAEGKA